MFSAVFMSLTLEYNFSDSLVIYINHFICIWKKTQNLSNKILIYIYYQYNFDKKYDDILISYSKLTINYSYKLTYR